MIIRECTFNDVSALAQMNRVLIEDENAPNSMTIVQLEERMAGFLSGGCKAFFLEADGGTVGYALVNMNASPLYLQQFLILREARRKGYGRAAFHALLRHLGVREIDIDVYVWNEAGVAFWRSLGFAERFIGMRYRGTLAQEASGARLHRDST